MDKLVLYCKTYHRDFDRVKKLYESVLEHNQAKLPFYISAPSNERTLLEEKIGTSGYTFIPDEDIFNFKYNLDGWRKQQIIKSNFWKVIDTENYISLDSDSFFITNFTLQDFIHPSGTIYTSVHDHKELQQYQKLFFNISYKQAGYAKAVQAYRDVFGSPSGKIWDYGPPPYHWSTKVWKHFTEHYLEPNNLTFETFQILVQEKYKIAMREAVTYGEYLMATKLIDIYPTSGAFKFYYCKEMYDFEQNTKLGTLENLKENYLGVTIQSNWS